MWKLASIFFLLSFYSTGQYSWQWTELASMPEPTSNNAVCEAQVAANEYVYSFGGIDTTKLYTGIHLDSYKYDVQNNTWSTIDPLPDTLGKIAAGASFVKGKIYIIGGYHVFQGGSELSSDKVHVYNPVTDMYEADASPVPVAIDDHVQCVYKDSLIYVVTGWSNTTNVPNVQIFNPSLNTWTTGTNVINTGYFKSFGASGHIIGDTLYYHGGVSSGNFSAQPFMRKGYINPQDPTDITWTLMNDAPGADGYRSACSGQGNTVFWVGGAPKAYNYNGVAYDGSGGVNPSARILHFNNWNYAHVDQTNQPYGVMDFRGIAKLTGGRWIVCGGMDTSQVVSNRTFLLENGLIGVSEYGTKPPLPAYNNESIIITSEVVAPAKLINVEGRVVQEFDSELTFVIQRRHFSKGVYFFIQNNFSVKIQL